LEASSGAEALLSLQEQIPDLILLDLKIPPPGGYDVLKQVRNNVLSSSVPVLALTACAMLGERETALAAGFDGYLAKPVELARLRGEVERLLELRQKEPERLLPDDESPRAARDFLANPKI
jgi:CheY-like chemotaxis protein